jgi:hypothetical protein
MVPDATDTAICTASRPTCVVSACMVLEPLPVNGYCTVIDEVDPEAWADVIRLPELVKALKVNVDGKFPPKADNTTWTVPALE